MSFSFAPLKNSWHSSILQIFTTTAICVIHETTLTSLNQFLSGSNSPTIPANLLSPIPQFPIPSSPPHLPLTPETMVLDIGKHIFNYPWPHISLKNLHCTTPQGDTVHDLSPNLFMGHLLGRNVVLL